VLLPAPAQARVIGIEISIDGKPYLHGRTGDTGYRRPHHVWCDLKTVPLRPAAGVRLEPDEAGGTTTTLKGVIRIKVNYGATAEVSELRLVRSPRDTSSWSVAPEEVERIAQRLGLPETARVFSQSQSAWLTDTSDDDCPL
jgi:hypothetical protein